MRSNHTTIMKPTVGRIVHYHTGIEDAGPIPAIITGVHSEGVNLQVFYILDVKPKLLVPYSETPISHVHWSWPPRE